MFFISQLLRPNHTSRLLIVVGFCLILTGCSSLPVSHLLTQFPGIPDQPRGPVVEIMGLWQAGEGRDMQGLPTRGFAGQIFFFQQGNPQPTEIKGDIKIYVFDDQGTQAEQAKPIHCFEFKQEAWQAYLTETNIGKTYQVFIPYPRAGDHRAICTLRIKWNGPGAETLLSDPADIILRGRKTSTDAESSAAQKSVAPAPHLSEQRTHIASIGRGGKTRINSEQPTAPVNEQNPTSEIKNQQTSYNKNTETVQYERHPVVQTAHTPLPSQKTKSPINAELSIVERWDHAGWSLHHPLSNTDKQTPPTDSSNTTTTQPVSVSGQVQQSQSPETQPLLFEHPLLEPTHTQNTPSSLKVKTIELDQN